MITGLGIVSPYGCDVMKFYDRLAAGEIALRPTPWMPPEAGSWYSTVEDFNARDWMSDQVAEGSDRFAQFALAGTKQALADAGLEELDPAHGHRDGDEHGRTAPSSGASTCSRPAARKPCPASCRSSSGRTWRPPRSPCRTSCTARH